MARPALVVLTSDPQLRAWALSWDLRGVEPHFHDDPPTALSAARKLPVWLFVCDARATPSVPEGLVRKILALPAAPEVLVLAQSAPSAALELPVENLHVGAPDPLALRQQAERLLRLQEVRHQSGIAGSSAAIRGVISTIAQVAPLEVPVLIQGESGTGKELVAQALHRGSHRHERPFVSVNVGSLAETLLESELFGHERGAFTGAVVRREGVFERADGGTLFLDEVGEMSLAMQVKLLRVLETSEFMRVGASVPLRTDVRLLAATHRSLEDGISAGTFRGDLYYRLKVIKIEIPPLRERREDIPLLVQHFLEEANRKHGLQLRGITRDALDRFLRYAWPGNVRELRNVVSSMAVLARGERLGVEDLPSELREGGTARRALPVAFGPPDGAAFEAAGALLTPWLVSLTRDLKEVLARLARLEAATVPGGGPGGAEGAWAPLTSDAEFTPVHPDAPQDLAGAERAMIVAALRQHAGNRRRTAQQLGISERTLYRKLKRFGLG